MADDAALRSLSPAVAKPDHVPTALVYDYDKYADAALLADPHARMSDLVRNHPPIFWTPRRGGHWVMTSYEAVFDCSRDAETFSNLLMSQEEMDAMLASMPADAPHILTLAPSSVDPPVHAKYRLPLNSVFSPKRINVMKDSIRALARELVAQVAPSGRCDFMEAVAEPMPVQVFLKILGLPVERWREYRKALKEMMSGDGADVGDTVRRFQEVAAIMRPTMAERRDNPQDDLLSLLWATKLGDDAITMDDMEDYGVMLFIAGLDTVMNGIGFGVRHLATDLDLQDKLRADPSLVANAAEELLRRYTFTIPTRTLTRDTVFHGVQMKKGDVCNVVLGCADLDPARFDDPDRYDLDREAVHLAFGAGIHRCLGSHLARIELQVLYEELLAGLPRFELDAQKPPRFHGGHVIGPDNVNLVWDA